MAGPEAYESPLADDASIDGQGILYRRINLAWVKWGEVLAGGPGLSKQAFQDYPPAKAEELGLAATGMSVGSSDVLEDAGLDPLKMLDGFDDSYGLVGLSVTDVRSVTPSVGIILIPTDSEPWHAMVFAQTYPRLKKTQSRQLHDCVTTWLRVPTRP